MPQKRDHFYFTELSIANVRAFKSTQTLKLATKDGRPAPWTLIVGDNGVGKTTLLQCLVRMRPIAAFKKDLAKVTGNTKPEYVNPELAEHENDELTGFIRIGSAEPTIIEATISNESLNNTGHQTVTLHIGATITHTKGDLEDVKVAQTKYSLSKPGPLVIGYAAGRHVGQLNIAAIQESDQNESLFGQGLDLCDAAEVLDGMHHAMLDERSKSLESGVRRNFDENRYNALLAAIADLLPDAKAEHIDVRGPNVPGRVAEERGVHVKTPSGFVSLGALSVGYQTMFAWTSDLAWRLINAYPKSLIPLEEAAVVLVDEIDLHLHPTWQRLLRSRLRKHFPNVQFIATTHSPITAQESIAAGENVSVVRWVNGEAIIDSNPLEANEWRIDQVLVSELFEFETARSQMAESKLERRNKLLATKRLTTAEKIELANLNDFASSLPSALSPDEQSVRDELLAFLQKAKMANDAK